MNTNERYSSTPSGRMQWGSYGFMAGILLGVMVGWLFHGFVGAFVRVGMVALAVLPLILLYIAWRKVVAPWLRPANDREYVQSGGAIETRGVVQGVVHEPRPR